MNRPRVQIGDVSADRESLGALCRKRKIARLDVFGSATTVLQRPDTDIDLLADFEEGESWSLMDVVKAEEEFAVFLGRRVDLVDRKGLERSANWIRRDEILRSSEAIYGP